MPDLNTLRRVNWLWQYRHKNHDDITRRITTIERRSEEEASTDVGIDPTGATIVLARAANQSIPSGGADISWTLHAGRDAFDDPGNPATSVEIPKPSYYGAKVELDWDTFTDGGTVKVIRERAGSDLVVWPPAIQGGLWTDTDSTRFRDVVPFIHCERGDTLRVHVDHGDASAQNLAEATFSVWLIDRSDNPILGACPVLTSPVTASAVDHDAFPGLVVAADGTYVLAYRQGDGHISTDGVIRVRTSTDKGDTWSSPTTILTDAAWDYRGASLTRLADDTLVMVAEARTSAPANVVDGGFTLTSTDHGATWGAETRIDDGGFTGFSRSIGPVLELSNGDWLLPVYGEDSGDARTTTRVVKSSDSGATWGSPVDVADGVADGRDYNESGMIRQGNRIVMLIREGESTGGGTIWRSESQDDGATWSDPVLVISDDAQGAPKPTLRSNGDVVVVLRHGITATTNYPARLHRSADLGQSWEVCETFPNPGDGMAYAQTAEDPSTGKLALVRANESGSGATGSATIFFHREA